MDGHTPKQKGGQAVKLFFFSFKKSSSHEIRVCSTSSNWFSVNYSTTDRDQHKFCLYPIRILATVQKRSSPCCRLLFGNVHVQFPSAGTGRQSVLFASPSKGLGHGSGQWHRSSQPKQSRPDPRWRSLHSSDLHTIGARVVRFSWSARANTQTALVGARLDAKFSTTKKKILHHIKILTHVWSTKCRWNKKLIAQFSCTLRDESFEPN
jgi:hypothetical protein